MINKEHFFNLFSFEYRLCFSWLKVFFLLLAACGCLSIFLISRSNNSETYYFYRQVIWYLFSTIVFFIVSGTSLEISEKTAFNLLIFSLLFLASVLFFGVRINGMRGWYKFDTVFLQPAELLKPVFIICFARLWSSDKYRTNTFKGFILASLMLALPCLLIILQPDAGTVLIYAICFLPMLWVSGASLLHISSLAIPLLPAILIVLKKNPYMWKRIEAFLFSSEQMQLSTAWHAKVMQESLQNGGWLGNLFNNNSALTNVPYRSNDSIFAVLAEQLGFIGIMPLILLTFSCLAFCCYKAIKNKSSYESLLLFGSGMMLCGQAFLHLFVNLGLFPTTGVTFPFISYGGSSLLASMTIAAIIDKLVRSG